MWWWRCWFFIELHFVFYFSRLKGNDLYHAPFQHHIFVRKTPSFDEWRVPTPPMGVRKNQMLRIHFFRMAALRYSLGKPWLTWERDQAPWSTDRSIERFSKAAGQFVPLIKRWTDKPIDRKVGHKNGRHLDNRVRLWSWQRRISRTVVSITNMERWHMQCSVIQTEALLHMTLVQRRSWRVNV